MSCLSVYGRIVSAAASWVSNGVLGGPLFGSGPKSQNILKKNYINCEDKEHQHSEERSAT